MTSVNNRPEILTKLGVGSGLDTTALIEALVNAETEGVKETLDNKEIEILDIITSTILSGSLNVLTLLITSREIFLFIKLNDLYSALLLSNELTFCKII